MPTFTVFASYTREGGLQPATVLHGDFVRDQALAGLVACTRPLRWVQVVNAKDPATAEEVAAHTFSEGVAGELVPLSPGAGARVTIQVRAAGRPKPWQRPGRLGRRD